MKINLAKTKEIVFRRLSPKPPILPPPLLGIERVITAKLLGITISHDFIFSGHVNNIVSLCMKQMFLLKKYRCRGFLTKHIDVLFHALIVSRIL